MCKKCYSVIVILGFFLFCASDLFAFTKPGLLNPEEKNEYSLLLASYPVVPFQTFSLLLEEGNKNNSLLAKKGKTTLKQAKERFEEKPVSDIALGWILTAGGGLCAGIGVIFLATGAMFSEASYIIPGVILLSVGGVGLYFGISKLTEGVFSDNSYKNSSFRYAFQGITTGRIPALYITFKF